jgi:hypothetical protein
MLTLDHCYSQIRTKITILELKDRRREKKFSIWSIGCNGICWFVPCQKVGSPAPEIKETDRNGQTHQLSGKYVVLEWHNNGCPYTRTHYESGNIQRLQKDWTSRGVIWFTVISSAPGQQGYVTAQEVNEYLKRMSTVPTLALLDPQGDVGRLYSAKTTPHMFIINPDGLLI